MVFFVITFTKFKPDIKNSNKNTAKLKVKKKTPYSSNQNVVFMFNNFDEFCNFCTYFNNCYAEDLNKIAKKIVLYEYNSNFYLAVNNINKNDSIPMFYTSISEFAKLISSSKNFESKLVERGKVIIKHNAIKNGIKYFV